MILPRRFAISSAAGSIWDNKPNVFIQRGCAMGNTSSCLGFKVINTGTIEPKSASWRKWMEVVVVNCGKNAADVAFVAFHADDCVHAARQVSHIFLLFVLEMKFVDALSEVLETQERTVHKLYHC
jgi:hypothetical protein